MATGSSVTKTLNEGVLLAMLVWIRYGRERAGRGLCTRLRLWCCCQLLGAIGQRAVVKKVGYSVKHHVALEQVVHGQSVVEYVGQRCGVFW